MLINGEESAAVHRRQRGTSGKQFPINKSYIEGANTSADDHQSHTFTRNKLFRNPGALGKGK